MRHEVVEDPLGLWDVRRSGVQDVLRSGSRSVSRSVAAQMARYPLSV